MSVSSFSSFFAHSFAAVQASEIDKAHSSAFDFPVFHQSARVVGKEITV
ncbi:hypothetical protein [Acinetobacter sp. F_3_1]|nr:hypothetical protein [Acinetobacter sp. F_3_1]MCT8088270.1 hypothetical protein [Acinetobacter sp. F_3_1]